MNHIKFGRLSGKSQYCDILRKTRIGLMKANPLVTKITHHAQELKVFCAEVLSEQEVKDVCAKFHHPREVETKRWMTREKKRKDRGGE